MKKLFIIFISGLFLFMTGPASAGTPPVIQTFHSVFGNGYFTAIAKIYDTDNDLRAFEIGALYGVKFTGEKINIGDGCGYTCGRLELRPQGNGVYIFSAMLPSQKITSDFIYIIVMGKARDNMGNVTVKKIRAYPADLIPIFRRHLKQSAPHTTGKKIF